MEIVSTLHRDESKDSAIRILPGKNRYPHLRWISRPLQSVSEHKIPHEIKISCCSEILSTKFIEIASRLLQNGANHSATQILIRKNRIPPSQRSNLTNLVHFTRRNLETSQKNASLKSERLVYHIRTKWIQELLVVPKKQTKRYRRGVGLGAQE